MCSCIMLYCCQHPIHDTCTSVCETRGRFLPSVHGHGLVRLLEVELFREVVLGGHGLGEGALDVDSWGLGHVGREGG